MRRVVPADPAGRVVVKVVYTVLEAQYQSALSAAVTAINATNKTVCFELVGYLLEELRDASNFETFKADLADANVFIGSLNFIEELAEKVCTSITLQGAAGTINMYITCIMGSILCPLLLVALLYCCAVVRR